MAAQQDAPDRYLWLIVHRRLVLTAVAGTMGLIAILLGWWGVTNSTVVADQLSYIASGSVLGIFLLGVASMSYWAEQREREMSRLTEIEVYLGAMADMLGLTEQLEETGAPGAEAETSQASRSNDDGAGPVAGSRRNSPPRRRARTTGAT